MAVFAGNRQRDNNVQGTVTDNPLTAGATTLNSAGLANLSAVASNHAVLILDPLRTAGAPEIVIVTAHTGGATSATITRGAYGTTARSHNSGVLWVHAPTIDDTIRIVTSGARPTDVYAGQHIYENDTKKAYVHNGTDWAPYGAGGQLGYAQITANQTGITTTETDITGLSVTVTAATNRRLRLLLGVHGGTAVANDELAWRFREGATLLREAFQNNPKTTGAFWFEMQHIFTPTAGSHTYKATITRQAGSGTITVYGSATYPAYILCEDIGPA